MRRASGPVLMLRAVLCYNIDCIIVEQIHHLPNGKDVYDAVIDQIYKVELMARVDYVRVPWWHLAG